MNIIRYIGKLLQSLSFLKSESFISRCVKYKIQTQVRHAKQVDSPDRRLMSLVPSINYSRRSGDPRRWADI